MARFKDNSRQFKRAIVVKAAGNMKNVVEAYRDDLQIAIWNKAPSGEVYNIPPYGLHRASAPGEPPARLSGDLWRSIHAVMETSQGKLEGQVKSDVAYSPMLELGTRRIAPRPAWLPTLEENLERYRKIATEGFKGR